MNTTDQIRPVSVFFAVLLTAAAGMAATYTVTDPGDNPAAPTLRWAIESANANPGEDTIAFDLGVPYMIQPTGQLPVVFGPAIVDGTTQPGYAGVPRVCLHGGHGLAIGLALQRGSNTVKGLRLSGWNSAAIFANHATNTVVRACQVVSNAAVGVWLYNSKASIVGGAAGSDRNLISSNGFYGVEISGSLSSNNAILGNYIGTTPDGMSAKGNAVAGVAITAGSGNVVGGTNTGSGNLLSGNFDGVYLGSDAMQNRIEGNLIGTDPSGFAAIPNTSCGVFIRGAGNTVGGASYRARNLISGNANCGVACWSTSAVDNVIQGNYIGTDITGTSPLPNNQGIYFSDAGPNRIGGINPGEGNLISGNDSTGIHFFPDAPGNLVEGNRIGVDASGTTALGNGFYGIWIESASNTIGGATAGARNTISGNGTFQIWLEESKAAGNVVAGNHIGTDISGTMAVGASQGLLITGPDNLIGGTTAGERNLISGHASGYAVRVDGANATNNRIRGNYIGTDAGGTGEIPNNAGVGIFSANNEIGCPGGGGNVISASLGSGIGLTTASASGNSVECNLIGLDASGSVALGNGNFGIDLFQAPSNRIGSVPDGGNTIAGWGVAGIRLYGSNAIGNELVANRIGTDATGASALGNQLGVVLDGAPSNRIGGHLPGEGNVISGSAEHGVYLNTGAQGNRLLGNFIGTDADGVAPLPNAGSGLFAYQSPDTQIGGSTNGQGNLISGNGGSGIELVEAATSGTLVWGNRIGVNAASNALGNAGHGVWIRNGASLNWIGGQVDGTGNAILHNGSNGVAVSTGSASNAIIRNAIGGNGGLGIDLGGDGVTANDKEDVDAGANRLQNFPEILWATNTPVGLRVAARLNGRPGRLYYIEYFGSQDCDGTGYGEGETFLFGSAGHVTDGSGDVVFTNTFTGPAFPPNFLTMTATDQASLDTSEFSRRHLLDLDEDGMGDGYEHALFGDSTAGEPDKDEDDDGVTNLGEFIAATDGGDPASWMGITAIEDAAITGKTVRVRSTRSTRTYELQHAPTPHLPDPGDWVAVAKLGGNDGELEMLDSAESTSRFYRVKTELP
jgi:hypothetical protein